MFGRIRLALLAAGLLTSSAFAELEGIVFSIPSTGSYPQHRKTLDLSPEQSAQFTALRIDRRAEIESVYKPIRQELGHVTDEEQRQRWSAKHGPTIKQINYDLWLDASKILATEKRSETYYRMLLQDYLHTARDVHCIASLMGVELTWPQIQDFKKKVAENQQQLDGLLAKRRREIEAEKLGPYFTENNFEKLRGEEFVWEGKFEAEDEDGFGSFGPFDEMVADDTVIQLANNGEVLEELKASSETRKLLGKALSASRRLRPQSPFEALSGGGGPAEQQAAQLKIVQQKEAAEDELSDTLRACLSKEQHERLMQVAMQHHLRNFQYRKVLSLWGIQLDKTDARKLEQEAERYSREEYQFARAQLSIDMNARSFDEVASTNLASTLGKLVVFTYGTHHFGGGLGGEPGKQTPVQRYSDRYGSKAASPLKIPDTLTVAPTKRVEWNVVEVPDNWKLADAIKNLKEKNSEAQKIVDGNRAWKNEQDALRDKVFRAGGGAEQKELRKKYLKSQTNQFAVRRQFRSALEIATKEISAARRIVKQLGGDPGPTREWRSMMH